MQLYRKKLGKVAITVEKDPYDSTKDYDKLVIVRDNTSFSTYISRIPVPAGINLSNKKYWVPIVDGNSIITNCNEYIDNKKISPTITIDDIIVTFNRPYIIKDINNTQNRLESGLFKSYNVYDEVRIYVDNVLKETRRNVNSFIFDYLYSTTDVDIKFECVIGNVTIIKCYTIPLIYGVWYYADNHDLFPPTTISNSSSVYAGNGYEHVSFITKFTNEAKYLCLIIPKSYNPRPYFNIFVNGFPINVEIMGYTEDYWYIRSDTKLINDVDYHIVVDFVKQDKIIF